ncbi:MAG: hypothetical protein PHQ34_02555 [Methanothrix sp.]|nr:hypothetical protein [Methanothrix sp.]
MATSPRKLKEDLRRLIENELFEIAWARPQELLLKDRMTQIK